MNVKKGKMPTHIWMEYPCILLSNFRNIISVDFSSLCCFHLPGTPTESNQLASGFGRGKLLLSQEFCSAATKSDG